MPIVNGKYQAPTWVNNSSPAIDATELQAISDSIENALSDEDIAKLWIWDKGTGQPARVVNNDSNYAQSDVLIGSSNSTTGTITITYFDSAVVSDSGDVAFSGEHSVSGSYNNYTAFNVLKGKYTWILNDDEVPIQSYIPSNATITRYDSGSGSRYQIHASTVYMVYGVASTFSHTDYVSDSSSSAYPVDGTSGGYTYKRLGQVGGALDKNARIEVISYTGTGTYGSSNPTELTFSFAPKLIFFDSYYFDAYETYVYVGNSPTLYVSTDYLDFTGSLDPTGYTVVTLYIPTMSSQPISVYFKLTGTTLSFYSTSSATHQLNYSGTHFNVYAIG